MKKFLLLILLTTSFSLLASHKESPKESCVYNISQVEPSKSNLYPNPAKDIVFIKNTYTSKFKNIAILSMVGSTVINKNITNNNVTQELNVSRLSSGRYFVKITYTNGYQEIISLIKI